jgi:putative transposase
LTNANKLGAMARQACAEKAWASLSRLYENVKKGVKGRKVGFPKFQQNCRSVEYKTNSGKLADARKSITFTHKCGIGRLKMKGTRDLG